MFKNTPIYEYCLRVQDLKGKDNQIFKIVLDVPVIKKLIEFLNTDQQLGVEHVNSKGEELTNLFKSGFSDNTVYSDNETNRRLGRVGNRYELRLTGAFWESFTVEVGDGFIVIDSNPIKRGDNLFDMFADVEGLTESSLEVLIKEALNQYINWFTTQILPQ